MLIAHLFQRERYIHIFIKRNMIFFLIKASGQNNALRVALWKLIKYALWVIVMPNSYNHNRIFCLYLTAIKDSYNTIAQEFFYSS